MNPSTVLNAFRRPSAFVPVLLSLSALLIVVSAVLLSGPGREPDEGAAAHLFQLCMVAQLPLIAYFTITARKRAPGQLLLVLGVQLICAAVALAPVALLGL